MSSELNKIKKYLNYPILDGNLIRHGGLAGGTIVDVVGVVIAWLRATVGRGVATWLPGRRLSLADDLLRLLMRRAQCGHGHRRRGREEKAAGLGGGVVGGGDLTKRSLLVVLDHLPVERLGFHVDS